MTPSSGQTTSTETNTWTGTSSDQRSLGEKEASRPANEMTSQGSAQQPAASDATRYPPPIIEDDNESNGTVTYLESHPGRADTEASRVAILQAELELQQAEYDRDQAKFDMTQRACGLARSRLEIAKREASQQSSSTAPPPELRESRALGWVEQHRRSSNNAHPIFPPPDHSDRNRHMAQPRENDFVNSDFAEMMSNQLENAVSRGNNNRTAFRGATELPTFDGNITEWIAFKAEYNDTSSMFTNVGNVSRIRKSLRGAAKLAVKSIMYTASDPNKILEALERQFGDPEEIVLAEMHTVRRMPRLADDMSNITTFANQVANVVSTIESLGQNQFLYSPEMVNAIADKMNNYVRYEWNRFRAQNKSLPGLTAMAQYLNEASSFSRKTQAQSSSSRARINSCYDDNFSRVERKYEPRDRAATPPPRDQTTPRARDYSHRRNYYSQENCSDSDCEPINRPIVAQTSQKTFKKASFRTPNQTTKKAAISTTIRKQIACVICNGQHNVSLCADFVKMQIAQRWELAKKMKLCFRCLEASHKGQRKCKYVACGVEGCEAGHNRLLHGLNATLARANNINETVNYTQKLKTYLKIAPIELSGPLGVVETYALLDDGSGVTMIERHIADQIAPRGRSEPLSIEGVGGNAIEDRDSCVIDVSVRGICRQNREVLTAHTIEKLNLGAQTVAPDIVAQCEHLRGIEDELCYGDAVPTVLVGQDQWELLLSKQFRSGKKNLPVASLTVLGWVLHGSHKEYRHTSLVVDRVKLKPSPEDEIVELMKQHFSIESLGVEKKVPANDPDQRALKILAATCTQTTENSNVYQAGLLWQSEDETLPDSKNLALKRLCNLENKLDKNEELKIEYSKQVSNLLEKGYAEVAQSPPPPDSPRVWYLPHFPVVHAQKKKTRLVFDAAARVSGKCLNDALLPGPDLLQSLFGVLLRFREGKIGVIADVQEMFLQINVIESDRDSLRFLWRGEDRHSPPTEYRMKKIIFGSACSPVTALYVKNKNAENHEEQYPRAAEITIRNSYMDDFLIALDDSEMKARKIINDVYALNKKASFELTGFASNRPTVVEDVVKGSSNRKESTSLGEKCDTERTLGLIWNHQRDTLGFNINLRTTPPDVLNGTTLPTKRQVTSTVMSIYDPLGYISPISVLGKALIQDIWRTGIEWDDVIVKESVPMWNSFIENTQQLRNLEIDRYVPASNREGELHTFCDASEKVYAAVVYFVSNDPIQGKTSRLVAAKARVAPLKTISIPRLELQSCVLGTRLAASVKEQTNYKIRKCYYWSDSRTALSWIKSDPRSFKSFVAHRLAEIEDATVPSDWRWVPSALNTADDATKGPPAKFNKDHRWFFGPEFIRQNTEEWPVDRSAPASVPLTGEERPPKLVLHTQQRENHSYLPNVNRFSNFKRLIRTTATVLLAAEAFKAKLLKSKCNTKLNNDHLRLAELLLIKRSQRDSFPDEIKNLKRDDPIRKGSSLRMIAVKLDNRDMLLLDSRIDRSTKIPVLHAKNHFTRLLIAHFHELFNHGNHKTVMNELNKRYHIVGLRGVLRYICRKCQWCKTHKGTPIKLPMGDLPPERLTANQPAFTATACDLFGPMTITIGRRHEKRWGVLFTCLTTRAVHMELAASLSAASLILALRRMMARRGTPTIMYTDNATNFCGAEREIGEALQAAEEAVETFVTAKEIVWKKIPPGNPEAGGAWERLVGSIKTALRATLKEKHPPEEVLHTLVLEAEHIVNSRPLTPITTDNEVALTPNHFLLGRSNAMTPFGSFRDAKVNTKSWHLAQTLADHFWSRWTREYRDQLRPRMNRRHGEQKNIKKGDIVIIVDGTMPRGTWPKGEVVNTFPGPDGVVRVIDVRTNTGIIRRPASRLIVIS